MCETSNGSGFLWRLDTEGNFGFAKQLKATPNRIVLDFSSNVYATGTYTGAAEATWMDGGGAEP